MKKVIQIQQLVKQFGQQAGCRHIFIMLFVFLNNTAGLLGLEITGIRDRKTGKEWKKS